jgi:hypothetical protein
VQGKSRVHKARFSIFRKSQVTELLWFVDTLALCADHDQGANHVAMGLAAQYLEVARSIPVIQSVEGRQVPFGNFSGRHKKN